jgi:hypothetical protein
MTLEELKAAAQKLQHKVIRRDGEAAWRPLKNWKGLPTGTVVYYLIGNKVIVRSGLENDVHCYTLN